MILTNAFVRFYQFFNDDNCQQKPPFSAELLELAEPQDEQQQQQQHQQQSGQTNTSADIDKILDFDS
jgi:hypothetical protein